MTWRNALYMFLLVFVITLALIIGWRLSDQAMAVIIGVVAGVAASIPTSLIVVWVALRSRLNAAAVAPRPAAAAPAEPQVIIIHSMPASPDSSPFRSGPSTGQRSLTALPAYAPPQAAGLSSRPLGARNFTIIGGDDAIE